MKQQTYARVYRFHDTVAFTTDDSTETMYLAPELAQEMAQLLLDCADDIEFGDFVDSELGTRCARDRLGDHCPTCRIKEHDCCPTPLVENCPCCMDTAEREGE